MGKLFSGTNDFRANATVKDCEELNRYYFNASSDDWNSEECPYGFKKGAAKTLLLERGAFGTKESNDSKEAKRELPILTKSKNKQKLKQRSVSMSDVTYQGLQKAYDDYNMIPNALVAESILYAALKEYGYIEE